MAWQDKVILKYKQCAKMLIPLINEDRPSILAHYLRLSPEDRYLRFFSSLNDRAITNFVENILDLEEGVAFGIIDNDVLVGVAYVSKPIIKDDRIEAEAGFSIDAEARSRGHASMLMSAIIGYCKGAGVDTLVMCCLSENKTMQKIARNFGLRIVIDRDEAYADLTFKTNNQATFESRRYCSAAIRYDSL